MAYGLVACIHGKHSAGEMKCVNRISGQTKSREHRNIELQINSGRLTIYHANDCCKSFVAFFFHRLSRPNGVKKCFILFVYGWCLFWIPIVLSKT